MAISFSPPVVLAPMAGITNRAFRRLCRESARASGAEGVGMYVSEMVTSRALVERSEESLDLVTFGPDEDPRAVQLYAVAPGTVAAAVRMLLDEDRADHIDLNFGCPVPKVTRKGGGSALPWKRDLFRSIVGAAIEAANGRVPVSVKMRKGIDDDHLTYLDAGRAAAEEGAVWVTLHGRTATQMYAGQADWESIRCLKEELASTDTAVLGNGDIWTAHDAMRMVEQTGADGVVVGRGCLGRPWLFGQLAAAFEGREIPADPELGTVLATLRRHAQLLVDDHGEDKGCRDIRKHMAWYLKGFSVRQHVRQSCSPRSIRISRSTPRSARGRGAVPPEIVARRCPTDGWTPATWMRPQQHSSPERRSASAADDLQHCERGRPARIDQAQAVGADLGNT